MAKLLFVNACIRGEASRTLRLGKAFLEAFREILPAVEIIEHDLTRMDLRPMDLATLERKEALCDAKAWSDPMFQAAVDFQQADVVVFAAPYWDLSFPSVLKVWVENVYVRNLTFVYEDDKPIGLCAGSQAVYITTAGSPIGKHDWGMDYIKDVSAMLGIPGFVALKAEGLDLSGQDVEALMARAEKDARGIARTMAHRLNVAGLLP